MKTRLLAVLLSPMLCLHAQKNEVFLGADAAWLSFTGRSAVDRSMIIQNDFSNVTAYTNDVYSKKSGTGISIRGGAQRITASRFLYGLTAGLEFLQNKIPIYAVSNITGTYDATGMVTLHSKYLNIHPFAGYRLLSKNQLKLDLSTGVDLAFNIAAHHEEGSAYIATYDGTVSTDTDRDKTGLDIRVGGQLKLAYKRYAIQVSGWKGLSNYYKNYVGANVEAYSKIFRAGISYLIHRD